MNKIELIKKVLEKLEKKGITLNSQVTEKSVLINGTRFFFEATADSNSTNREKNEGLILSNSSKLLRRNLQKKEISYIDYNGNIYINASPYSLLIENKSDLNAKKNKLKSEVKLSPTNLISPNGLAFIEVLFCLADKDLVKFDSTLQFCKRYNLYQPKASQIMHRLKTKSLIECKVKLKKFSLEWWLFAFENPASKRKMTPFFKIAQNYYSLDEKMNHLSTTEILIRINKLFPADIASGPVEVAKNFGELIDDSVSIWVSPLISKQLKKNFKLIPGFKDGHRNWLLATTARTLESEELISHKLDSNEIIKTNTMRAVWDMGFGDYRMQEARTNILKRIISGL